MPSAQAQDAVPRTNGIDKVMNHGDTAQPFRSHIRISETRISASDPYQ